ncbi:hypothetical protein SDC9_92626 [bioreactor metagenome]|uniref:Uncharacterized protein n=1 Tax=bioreactor metagenome TaxID=1076179 RepID=A0A645A865_9ZZZZ
MESHTILAHIKNSKSKGSTELKTQIPVSVAKKVIPREEVRRCSVANIAFERSICLRHRDSFRVIVVDKHVTVLIRTGIFITVKLTYFATFLNTEEIFACSYAWFQVEIYVRSFVNIIR